jgi:rod shape-determining protein MreC
MKRLNIIALILFLVGVGWVFTFDTETTRSIKQRVGSVFSPFIRTGATVQEKLQGMGQEPRDPQVLAQENEELKRQVEELTLYARDRDQIRAENDELRKMLDFSKSQGLKVIPARITD